jgi:hypothetical protein
MDCNLKECYWNMWSPKHEMFNNEQSKQCVSEDLSEHFNEETDFQLIPNKIDCPSYRPYISFCGKNKED